MNHRNAIPANGMIFAATPRLVLPATSHCAPDSAPSGNASRISTSAVPNNTANTTPAAAAARGVVSLFVTRTWSHDQG